MFLKISKFFNQNTKWLEKQQTSILSAAFIITIANIASSVAGLLRERLLISSFFDSVASQQAYEAFQIAFQIPDMLFQLIVLGAVSLNPIKVIGCKSIATSYPTFIAEMNEIGMDIRIND